MLREKLFPLIVFGIVAFWGLVVFSTQSLAVSCTTYWKCNDWRNCASGGCNPCCISKSSEQYENKGSTFNACSGSGCDCGLLYQGGGSLCPTPTPSCSCGIWKKGSCGGWTCPSSKRHQYRICTPSGCSTENRCITDSSCGSGPTSPPAATNTPTPGSCQVDGSSCSGNEQCCSDFCSGGTCTNCKNETDGGYNPPEAGSIYVISQYTPGGTTVSDRCTGEYRLQEVYCNGPQSYAANVSCSNRCSQSACVETSSGTCTETDGGDNWYEKGTATGTNGTFTDKCSTATQLQEYNCDAAGMVQQSFPWCDHGCNNGACNSPPGATPTLTPAIPTPTATPIPTAIPTPTATPTFEPGSCPNGYKKTCGPSTGCVGEGVIDLGLCSRCIPPQRCCCLPDTPSSCLDLCQARGYSSGRCRWLKCSSGEKNIGRDNCASTLERCCCSERVTPTPTLSPTPTPSPTPAPGKKTISGTVFLDEDGDGERDAGESCLDSSDPDVGSVQIWITPEVGETKKYEFESEPSCNQYSYEVSQGSHQIRIYPVPGSYLRTGFSGYDGTNNISCVVDNYNLCIEATVEDAEVHFGVAPALSDQANLSGQSRFLSRFSQFLSQKINFLLRIFP